MRLTATVLVVVAAAGLLIAAGCTQPRANRAESPAEAKLPVPARPLRFDEAVMQIPATFPAPQQEGTYLSSEGTAEQVDPSIPDGKSIVVGINLYQSPESDFAKRKDVDDWASHSMPPNSTFRRDPLQPARVQKVQIPGAAEAAISVSLHEGYEPFGTGGLRALSLRLFVKPKSGSGGWVVGAYATGDAKNTQLTMDSQLAGILETIVRSFHLRPADAAPR